jgi:hypothetical protein
MHVRTVPFLIARVHGKAEALNVDSRHLQTIT